MLRVARSELGVLGFTFPSKFQIYSVFSFPNLLVKLTLEDDVPCCSDLKVCMPQTEQINQLRLEIQCVFSKPKVVYCGSLNTC